MSTLTSNSDVAELSALCEAYREQMEKAPSLQDEVSMLHDDTYAQYIEDSQAITRRFFAALPNIPIWQWLLLFVGDKEARRIETVCRSFEEMGDSARHAIAGTLRDSLVRRGFENLELSNTETRSISKRFVVFLIVERMRVHEFKRDEAIEFVAQAIKYIDQLDSTSANTIKNWYDRKSGAECTGLKRLARFLVEDPSHFVYPWIGLVSRRCVQGLKMVQLLEMHDIVRAAERTQLVAAADWVNTVLHAITQTFRHQSEIVCMRSVEEAFSEVLNKTLPLLFPNIQ